MDRNALAKAYRDIGVAYIQAAEVLEGATPVNTAPEPAERRQVPERPFAPVPGVPVGSLPAQALPSNAADPQRCPMHGTAYRSGSRGLYCTQKGGDPAWLNPKGYCNVTPENAAQYVAIHSAR